MQVEFYRDDEARVTGWDAVRGKRTRIPGTIMALGRGDISHDLAQYVIEAASDYREGFWGLLERGATFRSTGRKRTKPGRALIAEHRRALNDSEALAGIYLGSWKAGEQNEVTAALSVAAHQFQALRPGERLHFEWPSAYGELRSSRAQVSGGGPVRR
jgi:hypothetical protein